MKVTVVLEQGPNNWGAHAPNLDDVVLSTGDTRNETINRFRAALARLIKYKHEEGLPAPDVMEPEIHETVSVQ